jgi:hypothetical protein
MYVLLRLATIKYRVLEPILKRCGYHLSAFVPLLGCESPCRLMIIPLKSFFLLDREW